MDTGLIRVPLNELRTNDEQTRGSEYERNGQFFRWVKNIGGTACVRNRNSFKAGNTVGANLNKSIVNYDGGAARSHVLTNPSGMPMTGIGKSGAGTGDHGWVQFRGPADIQAWHTSVAIAPGTILIGSATKGWATGAASTQDGFAIAMEKIAATNSSGGYDTCCVDIRCA